MPKKRVPSVDTLVRQLGQHARALQRELGFRCRLEIEVDGSKRAIRIKKLFYGPGFNTNKKDWRIDTGYPVGNCATFAGARKEFDQSAAKRMQADLVKKD